jgi:hypothetical protein
MPSNRLQSRLGEFRRHPLHRGFITRLQGHTALQGIGGQKIEIRFEIQLAQVLESGPFKSRYGGRRGVGA